MSLEIMHIDMDAFFAAIEQLDNPELKGKPVIVGGISLNNRGVVSTASYEARKYGVHSAMPIVQAKKLCPQGNYLPGRGKRYSEISKRIFSIFYQYTPLVEKISIDEAFLDLTGCHKLFGSSQQIGNRIKKEIKEKIGLVASVGLAPNKFLAKLASDMDKPDGFFIINEDEISKILDPLAVRKIWGVGKKTEKLLKERGIHTVGKMKKLSLSELEAIFGKLGNHLYYLARGIDNRELETEYIVKSISHEETYSYNLTDQDQIMASLMEMSTKVARRLRQKGMTGGIVFIKIRYGDFTTYTRRITLGGSTNNMDTIFQTGKRLLMKDRLLDKPVRLLGIGVGNLQEERSTQLSLFSDELIKSNLDHAIDNIKDKYGEKSIIRARNLDKLGKQ